MNCNPKIVFFLLLTATMLQCRAQKSITDTTVLLGAVSISSDRLKDFGTGLHVEKIDSLTIRACTGDNLADLLLKHSEVYIKSYGSGGLAMLSVRGTSAAHTAVLWNGFALQSPMNGTMDMALLPVSFADDIHIQYGGTGALFGSGAMGGTVSLNNQPAFGSGINASVNFNAGSFMNYGGQLSAAVGTAKTYTSVRAFFQQGRNDFPYRDWSGLVRQRHAAVGQYGTMLNEHLLIGRKQMLAVNLWQQKTYREIPPLMTQARSHAVQEDQSLRGSAAWQYTSSAAIYCLRTALISEKEHYTDSFPLVDSHNDFMNSITEFESRINAGKRHLLNAGLNNNWEQIRSTNYYETETRDRVSVFASYRFAPLNDKYSLSFSLREEYTGKEFLPLVPSAGAEGKLWKGSLLKVAASRIYRLPTFNDLYWNPGGNTDLSPENGWSEEIGLSQEAAFKDFSALISMTGFNSDIRNWIIWLPSEINASVWTPENIMVVWSRGLEARLRADYALKRWQFGLKGRFTFSRSTNLKAKIAGDASVNKQLIYTPQQVASASAMIDYRGYILMYDHHVTGLRYTSSDNSTYLPAFNTGNIRVMKNFNFKYFSLGFSFTVENLWKQVYQAIEWMPMPGRAYKGSVNVQFNKPINEKRK